MEADAGRALDLILPMDHGGNPHLEMTLANIRQMAYLSRYYAHKIRGATFKEAGQTAPARDAMGKAYWSWMAYSRSMGSTYRTDSFRNLSLTPDWAYADAAVLKEYTDLGGKGTPPEDPQKPARY
jgi:hypothetical protein